MNITALERTQATLEIFAACVCLMLCIIILMTRHKVNSMRIFVRMFFVASIIFLAEAGAYIFRGNLGSFNIFMTRLTNFTVFLLNFVLANLFVRYIYCICEEKGAVLSSTYKRLANLCLACGTLMLIINLFTGWMYYFDSANYYHRNILWYVFTAGSIFCLSIACYAAVKHRDSLNKLTLFSIMLYFAIPILAIVVQTYIYGLAITNLGIFFGVLIMLIVYLINWSKGDYVEKEITEKKRKLLQIIALFIIMVVSMSASILSCVLSIRRISNDTTKKDSQIIAHMINDNLDTIFLKPISVAESLSSDIFLKELLSKKNPTDVDNETILKYINTIRDHFGYQTVFMVNSSTNAYYTQNGIVKYLDVVNDPHDIWYKDFLASGKYYELNIDTDESNDKVLSAFINTRVEDENGQLIGTCGMGVVMTELQNNITKYEDLYDVTINIVDKNGLIIVASDASKIEADYLDNSYFNKVGGDEFYYRSTADNCKLTKYLELLDAYLVITDNNPLKINTTEITLPSIIIFIGGLFMMAIAFGVITIREQKTADELIKKRNASRTDDLTGLLNRHAYEEDLAELIASGNTQNTAIVMLDLNGLKFVNDNIGHKAGDELITGSAHCMLPVFAQLGKVYRIGGDEFVAILDCTKQQAEDSLVTLDHLTSKWKGEYISELSISKGYAHISEHPDYPLREIIDIADKRMYADKDAYYRRTGKNRRK